MEETGTVTLNEEKRRFELDLGDDRAVLEYRMEGKNMALTHTFVPDSHRGKGVADKLAKYALEYIQHENIKALVYCPFVITYLQRHPDYNSIVLEKNS